MNRWNERRGTVRVLLLEPDPEDARRFRELLEASDVRTDLRIVSEAESARAVLHQRGAYADAPRPDIVLLDPHLPADDGYEILAELESDSELKPIPTIVLSSSDAPDDIEKSYELNANAHVRKPDDRAQYDDLVRSLEAFWFATVQLPTTSR